MKKVLFVRNYMHADLLRKTSFSPKNPNNDLICVYGGDNKMWGKRFLEFIFERYSKQYDYIVIFDEDCLILDEDVIYQTIEDMEVNGWDIRGMHDGTGGRIHRYDVPNIFFTIFKTQKLLNWDTNTYEHWKTPILRYRDMESSLYEAYYKTLTYIIYGLQMKFQPIHPCTAPEDCRSTILSFNECPFCIHTWWGRMYGQDQYHTTRIDRIINLYKKCIND